MGLRSGWGAMLVLMGALLTGACSLGRKAAGAGLGNDRLSETRLLCAINTGNDVSDAYGCFQLQLNVDHNFAYFDVLDMGEGWTSRQSYRILVYHTGESRPWVLARGLSAGPGQTIELDPLTGHNVWDYEEWVVEWEYGDYGVPYNDGAAAARIAQDLFAWDEVFSMLETSSSTR